jgi:uncharacterized Zn finger protein
MYGIGSRLDAQPEVLFLLRGVDSADLIASAADAPVTTASTLAEGEALASDELADVFGVELETEVAPIALPPKKLRGRSKKAVVPVAPAPAPKKPRGRPKKTAEPSEKKAPLKARKTIRSRCLGT